MLAHITGEGSAPTLKGHLARPRRHFQSHDRRRRQSREGSGWVGWRQLVPLLRRRRNEQERRLFPLSSLGPSGMDGERDKKLRRVINYVQVRFILFYSAPPSPLFIFHLSRVYHRTVFTALHFFARPHTTISSAAARATRMTLTRSRGMSTRASEAHSDPFTSSLPPVSPEEEQQGRRKQRPQRCMTKTVAR